MWHSAPTTVSVSTGSLTGSSTPERTKCSKPSVPGHRCQRPEAIHRAGESYIFTMRHLIKAILAQQSARYVGEPFGPKKSVLGPWCVVAYVDLGAYSESIGSWARVAHAVPAGVEYAAWLGWPFEPEEVRLPFEGRWHCDAETFYTYGMKMLRRSKLYSRTLEPFAKLVNSLDGDPNSNIRVLLHIESIDD